MDPKQFLARVEAALIASQMTATAFGKNAIGDPTFVFHLRDGRECRSATVRKVLDFIQKLDDEQKTKAA